MATPEATPADVRGVIDTELSDADINNYLEDAAFDIDQTGAGLDTEARTQLEKYYAALIIVQTKDPATESEAVGDVEVTYDASTVEWLREQVDRRDPTGDLLAAREMWTITRGDVT